jgi:hypothetical protein
MGVHYENGNVNTPVIVLGDDPTDSDNVLVSRLNAAVSVPKSTVSDTEGTPTPETDLSSSTEAETATEDGDETDS